MNVDVLVDKPPSIRWYFAAVVPFSALILAISFISMRVTKSQRAKNRGGGHKLGEKEKSLKASHYA